ncbi:MAG: Bifunctional protein glmU [Firmicutes bacterium]|nr:Bifunctional protein glmU [Bacillota bacterium]
MADFVAIVLAAGKGTRMKSTLPKVLHEVGGKPMVKHVLDAAKASGSTRNILVIGFGGERVREVVGSDAEYKVQVEQLGTGHAVLETRDMLADYDGTVMVLCGDTPLLDEKLLTKLFFEHRNAGAQATVLTAIMPNPNGYGRVIRDQTGRVVKIVEQKDATPDELLVCEINTGIYCFESKTLFSLLSGITCDNAQGEYYLTDVIGMMVCGGGKVWAVAADDYQKTMGINSRAQLAEAEGILRQHKLTRLMDSGVTIMDLNSTFIDEEVNIAPDVIIYPFTWLEGKTTIGTGSVIGPNVRFTDTVVGENVTVHFTYAHQCRLCNNITVGPYVHLRPGTVLADNVKVGNFVEVKNTNVGIGSKIPHLSYVGDTDMGARVNIGSGTITVNYDGTHKHRTIIEDDAFIGCNTNLVAPVSVGKGAYVAAGSTITKNVPSEALGVARARQNNIADWTTKHKGRK